MQYIEYGRQNRDTVILLHGGGLSWWNYREEALLLQDRFRVILPVLDGHGGSDAPFTTIADNARRILDFIDRELGGCVFFMGGLSLGGQILLKILSLRPDVCRYAFVESALAVPSRLTAALIPPAFGSCYGLVSRRWFARVQFRYLRIRPDLFEDYYRDTCRIQKTDMIAFLRENALFTLPENLDRCRAEVTVFAGGRESAAMLRSARQICGLLPQSSLTVSEKLYHGEFSLNRPREYAGVVFDAADRQSL